MGGVWLLLVNWLSVGRRERQKDDDDALLVMILLF